MNTIEGNFIMNSSKENIYNLQDEIVKELIVGVKPIGSVFEILLNITTKGELQKRLERLGIDELVHPYVIFKFRNPNISLYSYERVKRIKFEELNSLDKDAKAFQPSISVNLPLRVLIQNHINVLGGYDSIIKYIPTTQNSQIFVKGFLNANGINSPQLEAFYRQPTEKIMANFDSTNSLVNKLTTLGLAFSVVMGDGYKVTQ